MIAETGRGRGGAAQGAAGAIRTEVLTPIPYPAATGPSHGPGVVVVVVIEQSDHDNDNDNDQDGVPDGTTYTVSGHGNRYHDRERHRAGL